MKRLWIAIYLLAGAALAQETPLLETLKSGASPKEKADACRELARLGTSQAVPVLASLLADEQLSHMARYALETIRDPSADAALRGALDQLQGRLRVGVISSLGIRQDAQAIGPLARLLTDADPAVAQAAARALGSIGGAAAPALRNALTTSPPDRTPAVCEGLLHCAESVPGAEAAAIYDTIRAQPNLPHHLRVAALRGAILSRGALGMTLLIEAIRTESSVPAIDAIAISLELQGADVTRALAGELASANEETQILLLQALGCRGDATAAPALVRVAQSGPAKSRIAAIHSLVQLGYPPALPVLVTLAKHLEPAVSRAAQTGLFSFPGAQADAAVLALLGDSDAKLRAAAIETASQRRLAMAVPMLLKATGDANASVVSASFKALGELASPAEIPSLVQALMKTQDLAAAESALSAICARQANPARCTDLLLQGLAQARGGPKSALLRVLGTVGDPQGLAAVRTATADPDPAIRDTALRTLCDWPSADALPDLGHIVQTTTDAKFKILALQGQLRLIPLQTVPDRQKVSQLKDLVPRIERKEEQRLLLGILGSLPGTESLALVVPYLATEGLQEEAGSAAVAIGEQIVARHPAEVAEAMKQVKTKNKDLAARAQRLLPR